MDTKIKASFWTAAEIDALPAESKLTSLWILTSTNIIGLCEKHERLFTFETRLEAKWLLTTLEALPKVFLRFDKGIWVRNYIRRQIGDGPALIKNNLFTPVANILRSIRDPKLLAAVLVEYPIIATKLPDLSQPFLNGLATPPQVLHKDKGEGEGEGEGDPEGRESERRKPKFDSQAFKSRVAAWFNRRPETPFSDKETRVLGKVVAMSPPPEDIDLLEKFYTAKIPHGEKDIRRRDLFTLLNNWQGELDKARNYRPLREVSQPSLTAQLKALDEEIAAHVANPNSKRHDEHCSPEQRQDFRNLRERRSQLNNRIARASA